MTKINWKLYKCNDCGRIPEIQLVDDSFVCYVCYHKYYTMGESKKLKKTWLNKVRAFFR